MTTSRFTTNNTFSRSPLRCFRLFTMILSFQISVDMKRSCHEAILAFLACHQSTGRTSKTLACCYFFYADKTQNLLLYKVVLAGHFDFSVLNSNERLRDNLFEPHEGLTVCRYNYKGSNFSSIILRP